MSEEPTNSGLEGESGPTHDPKFLDPKFLEALICPLTHGPLRYDREASELISPKARLAFPIRSGVPILLESEARELEEGQN